MNDQLADVIMLAKLYSTGVLWTEMIAQTSVEAAQTSWSRGNSMSSATIDGTKERGIEYLLMSDNGLSAMHVCKVSRVIHRVICHLQNSLCTSRLSFYLGLSHFVHVALNSMHGELLSSCLPCLRTEPADHRVSLHVFTLGQRVGKYKFLLSCSSQIYHSPCTLA